MKIHNAIPGLGLPLTEEQVREFLVNSKLNLQLGQQTKKESLTFIPFGIFSKMKDYILTPKKSKKTRNALRQKLVYFSIDDETFPYKGVKGKADIKLLENTNSNIKIAEKIIIKYMRSLENDLARWILKEIRQGNEAVLEINPRFYSAWSFA